MIKLKNVSKFYYSKGIIASGITKVNLDLDLGEFVVITGESGSGKSTLLNVISGLDSYEEGEMYIDGMETSHYSSSDFESYRKKYIASIFQSFNLINSYTVTQNVMLALQIDGTDKKVRKQKVRAILEKVGMTDYARTKVSKLSGGQKQRVAIARALAKDTKIIVADEPTGNLDSESAVGIVELLTSVAQDKLVVVVTHNYDQFENHATRVIKMYDGKIVEDTGIGRKTGSRQVSSLAAPAAFTAGGADETPPWEAIAAAGVGQELDAMTNEIMAGLITGQPGSTAKATAFMETSNAASPSQADPKQEHLDSKSMTSEEIKAKKQAILQGADKTGISGGDRLRLGVRNTFNILPKFLLLIIVFVFVSTAISSQYVTLKRQQDMGIEAGMNMYFSNYTPDRLVLKKENNGQFTEEDYQILKETKNVKRIVRDDMLLDGNAYIEDNSLTFYGYPMDISSFDGEVTYGKLPEKSNEILLCGTDYEIMTMEGDFESLIGRQYTVIADSGYEQKVVIAGISISEPPEEETSEEDLFMMTGSAYLYMSVDYLSNIREAYFAQNGSTVITANKTSTPVGGNEGGGGLVPLSAVPEGQLYVPEEYNYYFDNEKAAGRSLHIKTNNIYYTEEADLTVAAVYTKKNYTNLTGQENFDEHNGEIYINPKDYHQLYRRNNYQTTVYAQDSRQVAALQKTLEKKGYDVLALKDHIMTFEEIQILNILRVPIAVMVCLIVFFIAYFVIRLILRSRSTYFSILRMLGMAKRSARKIMNIEILLVAAISYGIFLLFVYLNYCDVINQDLLMDLIAYMRIWDYVILGAILLIMAFLISNRFMRSMFKKTALGTFREEA